MHKQAVLFIWSNLKLQKKAEARINQQFSTFMKARTILLLSTFLGMALVGRSQVVVQSDLTLDQYVNEILLGSGIEAFNIQLTGSPVQIGHLTGAENTPSPINAGLVLSSAAATNLACDTNDDVPFGAGVSGDPDLLNIANSVPPLIGQNFTVTSVNDICAIEFDFVATGDSIKFNYAFGSDEYLTWINSQFNDVFAFFLSGPGIVGPFSAPAEYPDGAINIAQLPGSNPPLPITISSVNNILNSAFYIDNPANVGICQNGFTVLLQASAEVQCGETYHIKLSIADGSDTALESVVILEAGSFASNDIAISASIPNAPVNFPEMSLLEGCVDGFITVFRPNTNENNTVLLFTEGTATSGDDYETLPEVVVFDEGALTADIPIVTILDGIDEDTETIIITYDYVNSCDESITVSITLNIVNYNLPTLDLPDPLNLCGGETTTVSAVPTDGFGPFTYVWSTGQTSSSIPVSGGLADSIFVDVTDYCGSLVADSFAVIIPEPILFPADFRMCLGQTESISPVGGAVPYTIVFNTDSLIFANNSVTPLFTGFYPINYIDACGLTGSTEIEVVVCETSIPNIFSPNGDGVNDTFIIEGSEGFPGSRFEVFNRWGGLVYENDNYQSAWRGDDLAEGTYYYVYHRNDGVKFAGYFQLVR